MRELVLRFERSGLISKSTEEKSSNRREQTRGNPENRQRNSTRRSGNWRHWDGTEKAHTTAAMTEGTGSAAARLVAPYQPENAGCCDLDADPDLRNIG
jgi:hypothetical protein